MKLLLTIPGVGNNLAPWLIAILHPSERFDTFWKAKRYIGLNPRQTDMGKKIGKQKVSRTGNTTLRSLLYLAALSTIQRDNRFSDHYKRKTVGGMPGKKAIVSTAERIFRTSYHVLRTQTPYHDPPRSSAPPPDQRPAHLVPQAEAARMLGVSRQAISQQVKAGKLRAEEWNGKQFVVLKYLEIAAQNKGEDVNMVGLTMLQEEVQ